MSWKTPIAKLLSKRRRTAKWLAVHDLSKDQCYPAKMGWIESVYRGAAVDEAGNAIPWLTYPFIAFIEERLQPQMSLFEYGSGNSTHWWATRVARVVACEHDKDWYEKIAPGLPANVNYVFSDLDGGYTEVIAQYQSEFDIVVIDGRERVRCAHNTLPALKQDGVVIWDNTDREKYRPGCDFLKDAGFRRIDFYGMAPILPQLSCTSIFYRDGNCIGL